MEKLYWNCSDIIKTFRLQDKVKSKQTLFNAEERGEIPKADRVKRGQYLVRQWALQQLPEIGTRYGFLKKAKEQEIICVYTAKGGVLKTTLSYCLARLLALNGIRTLIVGLDIQGSITELCLPNTSPESLEEYNGATMLGLYHVLFEGAPVDSVIRKTSLPTLSIIPETSELNPLEKRLRNEVRREYFLKDKLIPELKDFDVIIFDNGPNWSQLIENALVAANTVISPVGCDLGTYQAIKNNLSNITEYQRAMKVYWANFLLVPTLFEKTKLSQQIYGAYLNQYSDLIVPTPIRRAVKGQEALIFRHTPLEYDPLSPLAQDYYDFSIQVWDRILKAQENIGSFEKMAEGGF